MKKILTVASVALALTFGGNVMAEGDRGHRTPPSEDGGMRHHGGMGHHMMKRIFSKLDLNEQQQQEVKAIMTGFREQMQDKKEGRSEFKAQMKALVQSDSFDEAAVRALIESKHEVRIDAGVEMAKMKNQIWNVLNADQQEKLNEMMENMGRHGKRFMRGMFGDHS